MKAKVYQSLVKPKDLTFLLVFPKKTKKYPYILEFKETDTDYGIKIEVCEKYRKIFLDKLYVLGFEAQKLKGVK